MAFIVPEDIEKYAEKNTTPVPALLQELTNDTIRSRPDNHRMLSGQLEGTLLHYLVWLSEAKRILEIGTFTGFSALMMASALPTDGKLITLDIDSKAKEFATKYWNRSPHGSKIEIKIGSALETLKTLTGPFDLVFIDADKENYVNYYDKVIDMLSPKGIIAVDNVLWSGRALKPDPKSSSDMGIANFNEHVAKDKRVQVLMLTIRDGLSLIRKVPSA